MSAAGSLGAVPVDVARDRDALIDFLCGNEWPFHASPRLTLDDVAEMDLGSDDVAVFWIVDDVRRVGIVRLLDLGDIGDGAPLLDLRIAEAHRGRGIGTWATRWAADHLFATYPPLHRVEANTRHDNVAMQRALVAADFTLEGRLRQAWRRDDGSWFDSLVYGLLRSDRD